MYLGLGKHPVVILAESRNAAMCHQFWQLPAKKKKNTSVSNRILLRIHTTYIRVFVFSKIKLPIFTLFKVTHFSEILVTLVKVEVKK